MPNSGTADTPWLGRMDSLAQCRAAGLVPPKLSPTPTDDLFLAGYCAVCRKPTRFRLGKELYNEQWGYFFREALSCDHCTFNARMRAALQYFDERGLSNRAKVYLTEQVTPMFRYIKGRYPNAQGSEYLPDKELGSVHDGIRCEDLQRLTFASETFDAVISLDVLAGC